MLHSSNYNSVGLSANEVLLKWFLNYRLEVLQKVYVFVGYNFYIESVSKLNINRVYSFLFPLVVKKLTALCGSQNTLIILAMI